MNGLGVIRPGDLPGRALSRPHGHGGNMPVDGTSDRPAFCPIYKLWRGSVSAGICSGGFEYKASNPCLNNEDRFRRRMPSPGSRILVDHPTPVFCAVRPSGIGDPPVFTVLNHKYPSATLQPAGVVVCSQLLGRRLRSCVGRCQLNRAGRHSAMNCGSSGRRCSQ